MSGLDCYRISRVAHQWILDSPFEQSAVEMGKQLTESGYSPSTITTYLSCIGHLAHWTDVEGLQVVEISPTVIERFLQVHLPICRCATNCRRNVKSVRAAVFFWQRLACSSGLVKPLLSDIAPLIRAELSAFRYFLIETRGLQPTTCDARVKYVSNFLMSQFADNPICIEQLTPVDIANHMIQLPKNLKPGSIRAVCQALSSYLRFKALSGASITNLLAALPKVAQWRQSSLPKALTIDEVGMLLDVFDQSTRGGQRDYAIARCYIDLGLRTAEIARLKLDDINWRKGVIHIRSKGARVDALPLLRATGEAIVRYLENRGQEHATTAVFLRLDPPFDRAATADTIRGSIRNAAKRCGLSSRLTGPHKLRHTLAVRLVNSGVSFKEISDLMRHRDLDTTTIYAKVDMKALSAVTSAWPEKCS